MPDFYLKAEKGDFASGEWFEFDLVNPDAGGIDEGLNLLTSLYIRLFSDRLVEESELSFEDEGHRRGWWADQDALEIWGDANPIGSRLWLLRRAVCNEQTRARAELYLREVLDEMKADEEIAGYDIAVDRVGLTAITPSVTLLRHGSNRAAQRFELHWRELEA